MRQLATLGAINRIHIALFSKFRFDFRVRPRVPIRPTAICPDCLKGKITLMWSFWLLIEVAVVANSRIPIIKPYQA